MAARCLSHTMIGILVLSLGGLSVAEDASVPSVGLPYTAFGYQEAEGGVVDEAEPAEPSTPSPTAQASTERWFDGETPWKGFVTGLRDGFETFPRPIGSPIYFEDPFINSDLRPVVLYNEFPNGSVAGGGDLVVLACQARLALTERLQFFANIDGWADLEAKNLPEGEGYNNLGLGLKYALLVDRENLGIVSAGVGWRPSNGSREVLQGIEDEIFLFVSGARAWDRFHLIGNVTGRLTTHSEQGNDSLSWNVNASYELFEDFFPLIEYHGFLYLSNGSRIASRDGLLDYGNLGASDVRGSSAHWGTVGFRWNFIPHVSWGFGYGFALRSTSNNDILDRRVTMNLIFTY